MPGDPRSWEMVSVWDWVSPNWDEGLVGTGCGRTRPPVVRFGVCR